MGLVPNCGLIWTYENINGLKFKTNKVKKYFKSSRESSFQYVAPRLYNILPRELRDDRESSMEVWKVKLDELLDKIPDQPRTRILTPELSHPITSQGCNSILQWIPHLRLNKRIFIPHDTSDEFDIII